jgi:hypothetical protein
LIVRGWIDSWATFRSKHGRPRGLCMFAPWFVIVSRCSGVLSFTPQSVFSFFSSSSILCVFLVNILQMPRPTIPFVFKSKSTMARTQWPGQFQPAAPAQAFFENDAPATVSQTSAPSSSLMKRFSIMLEVSLSKIFPAGFGWQAGAVWAGSHGIAGMCMSVCVCVCVCVCV